MGVIFPIVFFFLNTTTLPAVLPVSVVPDSEKVIYLVKMRWHTGIIFKTDQIDTAAWKFINDFKNYEYVDVGWGDEQFYQHPGFDIDLALRALFIETNSTMRISGINRGIQEYLQSTDYAERLILTDKAYQLLCSYVQSTYSVKKNRPVILSEHFNGGVKFYKAKGYYTVMNTCNTWIARALKSAGYQITDNVILSEQLFRETTRYGTMVKVPED